MTYSSKYNPDYTPNDIGPTEDHPVSPEKVEELKQDWEQGRINEIMFEEDQPM